MYGKQAVIYIALAALIVIFTVLSMCYGGYRFEFSVVAQVVLSRIVDGTISALNMPSQAFAPYARACPPLTGPAERGLSGLATLVHPVAQTWPDWIGTIVWEVRFPRVLMVVLVGAGLAVSGATFQGTFRNPLVSENILGVASGAGFGAAIGILLGSGTFLIELMAFAFGLLTLFITLAISRTYKSNSTILLVLAGVIVGSAFAALTSLIKYLADPLSTQLATIVFWLMGSFSQSSYDTVFLVGPVIIACTAALLAVRWRMNVLSLGDEEAQVLGIDVGRLRTFVLLCATIITAAAVSVCGTISWVGLVIPHMARLLVGADHRYLVPLAIVMGAAYMLIVDTLCLSLSTSVIPTNIITSIVGAPVFIYLLIKSKDSWTR